MSEETAGAKMAESLLEKKVEEPAKVPAPPAQATATVPLTGEIETPEDRWNAVVERFKKAERGVLKDTLISNYEKGQFVVELSQSPDKYGGHKVEEFAKAIDKAESTVYSYGRFAMCYTLKQVEDIFVANSLPWRVAGILSTCNDEKSREKLTDWVVKKRPADDELERKVKEANKEVKSKQAARGEKVDRRGGITPAGVCRTTAKLCAAMEEKAGEFVGAFKEIMKLEDEGKVKKVQPLLKAAMKGLNAAHEATGDAVAKISALLEKSQTKKEKE